MKKTAVQQIIEMLIKAEDFKFAEEIKCFLAIEKQQILDAVVWFDGTDRRPFEIEKEAKKYYSEKYEA